MKIPLAALLLVTAVLPGACGSGGSARPAPAPAVAPAPTAVRKLGTVCESAASRSGVARVDGVSSIVVEDGTLWLLNRPVLLPDVAGPGPDAHVACLAPPGDWRASDAVAAWRPPLATAAPLVALPEVERARSKMPLAVRVLHGLSVSRGMHEPGEVFLYYAVVRPRAGRDAELLGVGVARGDGAGAGPLVRVEPDGDWRLFGRGAPLFGTAVIQADMGITEGFDYVFGVRGDAATHRVYVARVPHGDEADRGAYRFFAAGSRWSARVADAVPLFAGAPGGLSVSYNRRLGGFLAVYARPEGGELAVIARLSNRPEGPWGEETTLLRAPATGRAGRGDVVYGAREHPQLALEDGRVLHVTVAASGPGVAGPELWRIELP